MATDRILTAGLRPRVVRRLVGVRLPVGSVVVDAAWHEASALSTFMDDYRTLAVTGNGDGVGGPAAVPATLRGNPRHLPLAGASVDCVLLLYDADRSDGGRAALVEARRVLRPGGLAVMAADARQGRAAAAVTASMVDAGLVTEQMHHPQVLLHPASFVGRVRSWASERRDPPAGVPWLCRVVTVLGRAGGDGSGRRRWPRSSGVVAFGRKP